MDGFDRIYDLHRLLKGRRQAMPLQDILSALECSRATFNRVKRHMTDFLGAPIVYSRDLGGYFYDEGREQGYELPGLWLNEGELRALLLIQSLLKNLGTGFLAEDIYPIEQRLSRLLSKNAIDVGRLQDRIRLIGVAARRINQQLFTVLANAVLTRSCLRIQYIALSNGQTTERFVSPQRIIQYRNNWYVDCWCHAREQLRTFALACMKSCSSVDQPYVELTPENLDKLTEGSYGLSSAENIATAVLHFNGTQAFRVALEEWHPDQSGEWLNAHTYALTLPYNSLSPHELIADILRCGEGVEVVEPALLRDAVRAQLQAALARYGNMEP